MAKMDWRKLFSKTRLNRTDAKEEKGRNSFQQDLDRIVFSGSFRRLANKTQVHPLAENDLIHNRLTHSIETGSVGRSLGTAVGNKVVKKESLECITEDEFGNVVQAACLAHDIGNPPFGHAGEIAIGGWFQREFADAKSIFHKMEEGKQREFVEFEGNAQGFRILTQLENRKYNGGLQLTHAVLATFTKYPRPAYLPNTSSDEYIGAKKYGYFASERKYYDAIATELELLEKGSNSEGFYCRHPLAFLVEAADDICYVIVDLEDAVVTQDLQFTEVEKLLEEIVTNIEYESGSSEADKIAYLRARAIGCAVEACTDVFMDNYDQIMTGKFSSSLTKDDGFKYLDVFKRIRKLARSRIFTGRDISELEVSGHKIIYGLLDIFKEVIHDLHGADWESDNLPPFTEKLVRIAGLEFGNSKDLYTSTHVLTDYVSGMTDRYAADLYKKLSGHL